MWYHHHHLTSTAEKKASPNDFHVDNWKGLASRGFPQTHPVIAATYDFHLRTVTSAISCFILYSKVK